MKWILVALCFTLVGCGSEDFPTNRKFPLNGVKGLTVEHFNEICLRGVSYYIKAYGSSSFMAPVYETDSKVKLCNP